MLCSTSCMLTPACWVRMHCGGQCCSPPCQVCYHPNTKQMSYDSPGVFIAGLQFGTPPQNIPLLIDTGSSVTHIAGIGCGSSCGVGLPNTIGYNLSASSTGQRVPCGDSCLCSGLCSCDVSSNSHGCAYTISYRERNLLLYAVDMIAALGHKQRLGWKTNPLLSCSVDSSSSSGPVVIDHVHLAGKKGQCTRVTLSKPFSLFFQGTAATMLLE